MLEGLRKFILGESAIIALMLLAIVAIVNHTSVDSAVCYAIAGVAGSVSVANAIKSKNGKG